MCVVGLIIGEPAADVLHVHHAMFYGTARRPDRRATREKCHIEGTSYTSNLMCPCALLTGAHAYVGANPSCDDVCRRLNYR